MVCAIRVECIPALTHEEAIHLWKEARPEACEVGVARNHVVWRRNALDALCNFASPPLFALAPEVKDEEAGDRVMLRFCRRVWSLLVARVVAVR